MPSNLKKASKACKAAEIAKKPGIYALAPGKLAQALAIDGTHHGLPMAGKGRKAGCGLKEAAFTHHEVTADIRVGISKAVDFPWRFLMPGHPHLSVPYGRVKVPG